MFLEQKAKDKSDKNKHTDADSTLLLPDMRPTGEFAGGPSNDCFTRV